MYLRAMGFINFSNRKSGEVLIISKALLSVGSL